MKPLKKAMTKTDYDEKVTTHDDHNLHEYKDDDNQDDKDTKG